MIGPAGASLPLVFVNGVPVASDTPAVSARDRGFTLADGLFETMRARRGVVFRLNRHVDRLTAGLRTMRIPVPPGMGEWVADAVRAGGPSDLSVRVTVTRGVGPGGIAPPAEVTPTVVVMVASMPQFPDSVYSTGLSAVIASGRRNARSLAMGLKTVAYTDAVLAWFEAQRAGADEAIFLDTDDHCSEATASNLFICRGRTLVTPPLSCAALPGVTRAIVLELAASIAIAVEERPFGADALFAADEVFLTSSLRGIAPVRAVQGHRIGTGSPGPVTRQIAAAYQALIDQECSTT